MGERTRNSAANSTAPVSIASEGVDIDELVNAPITYYDGCHNNYEFPPAESRHL